MRGGRVVVCGVKYCIVYVICPSTAPGIDIGDLEKAAVEGGPVR